MNHVTQLPQTPSFVDSESVASSQQPRSVPRHHQAESDSHGGQIDLVFARTTVAMNEGIVDVTGIARDCTCAHGSWQHLHFASEFPNCRP